MNVSVRRSQPGAFGSRAPGTHVRHCTAWAACEGRLSWAHEPFGWIVPCFSRPRDMVRKHFVHKSGCVGNHVSILSNSIPNISLPSLTPRHFECLFHRGSSEALHQPDILPRTKLKPMHTKNISSDMHEIQMVRVTCQKRSKVFQGFLENAQ